MKKVFYVLLFTVYNTWAMEETNGHELYSEPASEKEIKQNTLLQQYLLCQIKKPLLPTIFYHDHGTLQINSDPRITFFCPFDELPVVFDATYGNISTQIEEHLQAHSENYYFSNAGTPYQCLCTECYALLSHAIESEFTELVNQHNQWHNNQKVKRQYIFPSARKEQHHKQINLKSALQEMVTFQLQCAYCDFNEVVHDLAYNMHLLITKMSSHIKQKHNICSQFPALKCIKILP